MGFARQLARELVAAALAEEAARSADPLTPNSVAAPDDEVAPQPAPDRDAVSGPESGSESASVRDAALEGDAALARDAAKGDAASDLEPWMGATAAADHEASVEPEASLEAGSDAEAASEVLEKMSVPGSVGEPAVLPEVGIVPPAELLAEPSGSARQIARALVAQALAEEVARDVTAPTAPAAPTAPVAATTGMDRSEEASAPNQGTEVMVSGELGEIRTGSEVEGTPAPAMAEGHTEDLPDRSEDRPTSPTARIDLLPEPDTETEDPIVPLPGSLPLPEAGAADPTVPLPGLLQMPGAGAAAPISRSSPPVIRQPDAERSGPPGWTIPASTRDRGQGPERRLTVVDRWRARRHRKRLAQEWAPGATPAPLRAWRWLLVTIVLIAAFGVLFALTVAAIRDLVAL